MLYKIKLSFFIKVFNYDIAGILRMWKLKESKYVIIWVILFGYSKSQRVLRCCYYNIKKSFEDNTHLICYLCTNLSYKCSLCTYKIVYWLLSRLLYFYDDLSASTMRSLESFQDSCERFCYICWSLEMFLTWQYYLHNNIIIIINNYLLNNTIYIVSLLNFWCTYIICHVNSNIFHILLLPTIQWE